MSVSTGAKTKKKKVVSCALAGPTPPIVAVPLLGDVHCGRGSMGLTATITLEPDGYYLSRWLAVYITMH